ncbi:MAG: YggS family pyridoxal phosphate-dependent enzyme [Shewanella sp.]
MPELSQNYQKLNNELSACSKHNGISVNLLAVSKMQDLQRIIECAALGQKSFGENYVQEAVNKIQTLRHMNLQWHLIGPLQSNKCKVVAENFDWVQTIDRIKIIDGLNQYRPASLPPLNVLIQVNIDNEPGKSGCAIDQVMILAEQIALKAHLRLRGLMAIPDPETSSNGIAFSRMQELYLTLRSRYTEIDTLSMGMSDDFPIAIAYGANLVRVGTALFGPRKI